MKRNIAALVSGFVLMLFVVTSFGAPQTTTTRTVSLSQQQAEWEYARLIVSDNQAAFHAGETDVNPQVFSIEALYRRLGGRSRANLTNLLNAIGSDGWELVLVSADEMNWTFKRRSR